MNTNTDPTARRNAARRQAILENRRKAEAARFARIADKHGVVGCSNPGRCEFCR